MSVREDLDTIQAEMLSIMRGINSEMDTAELGAEVERVAAGVLQLTRCVEAMRGALGESIDIDALASAHERAMDSAARDIRDAIENGLTKLAEGLSR